jgi:creatinine amidohydrolase/Fe(II)-dependent formamide hydrolase-like protein
MRSIGTVISSLAVMGVVLGAQPGGGQQQGQAQQGQGQQGQAAGQQQGAQGRGRQAGPPSMGGGQCANNPYNCPDTPNPLPKANTVWIEEMTWMDVRDALKEGKTTVIISTGGVEPNGPWLATGKHNYVLRANCDAIARKLGDALCAPVVPFVPEGGHEPPTSHMTSPGTISLTEPTFQALLTDIVKSFKAHGFKNIMLIGDSGGNTRGMQAVATALNTEWGGSPLVAHIREHYDYGSVEKEMASKGLIKEGASDGLHDDPIISLNMFMTDPKSIRYEERVKAGKATINGVSLADRKKNLELGRAIVEFRATVTANAIKRAIEANKK